MQTKYDKCSHNVCVEVEFGDDLNAIKDDELLRQLVLTANEIKKTRCTYTMLLLSVVTLSTILHGVASERHPFQSSSIITVILTEKRVYTAHTPYTLECNGCV